MDTLIKTVIAGAVMGALGFGGGHIGLTQPAQQDSAESMAAAKFISEEVEALREENRELRAEIRQCQQDWQACIAQCGTAVSRVPIGESP